MIDININDLVSLIFGPMGALALAIVTLVWVARGASAVIVWLGGRIDKWVTAFLTEVRNITQQNKDLMQKSEEDREMYKALVRENQEAHIASMEDLVDEFKKQGAIHSQKLDQILYHVQNK
jgi:hypothetical protein